VKRALLEKVLHAKTPDARAAATHVLADEWDYVTNPMALLRPQVNDEHPRVRLEAVRALSFVGTTEAVELALAATRQPLDYWLEYTLQHTLGALESVWKDPFQRGQIAEDNPQGRDFLKAYLTGRPQLGAVQEELKKLLESPNLQPKQRQKAMSTVAAARGKADEGRQIFERICVACHKVGDKGADFGPDITHVAGRLKREDLVESIIDPNAKIDPKYLATNITTKDGDEYSGLVASEDDQTLTIVLGAGQKQVINKNTIAKRETLKVSSMPEGLASSISPQEFVDLIEFLSTQK
jgi:putative heme-binding domain-containing protein